MNNSTEVTKRDNALAIGLLLGVIAGIILAVLAQTNKGRSARQQVNTQVGRVDLGAVRGRIPNVVQESVMKGQSAISAGRDKASGLINRSAPSLTTADSDDGLHENLTEDIVAGDAGGEEDGAS